MKKIKNHIKKYEYTNRMLEEADVEIKIIESGYAPSNLKQGYVLRKILREIYKCGSTLDHEYFTDEIKRQDKILDKYNILKNKHVNKSKQWWYETHGIDLDEI